MDSSATYTSNSYTQQNTSPNQVNLGVSPDTQKIAQKVSLITVIIAVLSALLTGTIPAIKILSSVNILIGAIASLVFFCASKRLPETPEQQNKYLLATSPLYLGIQSTAAIFATPIFAIFIAIFSSLDLGYAWMFVFPIVALVVISLTTFPLTYLLLRGLRKRGLKFSPRLLILAVSLIAIEPIFSGNPYSILAQSDMAISSLLNSLIVIAVYATVQFLILCPLVNRWANKNLESPAGNFYQGNKF